MPNAKRLMPNAYCLMPNAYCLMPILIDEIIVLICYEWRML